MRRAVWLVLGSRTSCSTGPVVTRPSASNVVVSPMNVIMQIGGWEASEMVRRYVGEYDPA